jgi:hypothetical protein
MPLDHRLQDEALRELILAWPCGCAFLLRTREQVACCPDCPQQLLLPLEASEACHA